MARLPVLHQLLLLTALSLLGFLHFSFWSPRLGDPAGVVQQTVATYSQDPCCRGLQQQRVMIDSRVTTRSALIALIRGQDRRPLQTQGRSVFLIAAKSQITQSTSIFLLHPLYFQLAFSSVSKGDILTALHPLEPLVTLILCCED